MDGIATTPEWERLVTAAKDHERESPEKAPRSAEELFPGISALIDAAEAEEAPQAAPERKERHSSILCVNGWPERYVIDAGEPSGGEWLAAFALAAPVIESGGICVFHGKRGTGKTRMASEIARTGRFPLDQTRGKKSDHSINPRRTAVYRTAMRFFTTIRATYRKDAKESEVDVIDALTEPGLLVIDELQERGDTPFEDRLLTHLIDARYGAMRPTILIANLTEQQLFESINPSIADRIAENGRRIEFTWNSYRRK